MKLVKSLIPFLITSSLALIIAIFLIFTFDKKSLHYAINQYYSNSLDLFFKYVTHLGDGLFAVAILLIVLYYRSYRSFFIGVGCFAFSGIFSQLVKNFIAPNALRPSKFFEPGILHLVEGVQMNLYHSFPSGHTATAFAMFLFLAYFNYKNKFLQIILAFLSIIVGYSRIYLSQHFLQDVTAGAILGIATFFLSILVIDKMKFPWMDLYFKDLLIKKTQSN